LDPVSYSRSLKPNGNKKFVQKKNAGIEKRLEKKSRRLKE
jgi:hypothetical protein